MGRDYDLKEERKKAAREEAQLELKRSWERHGHLKRLRALAKAGPAAVRSYAVRCIPRPIIFTTGFYIRNLYLLQSRGVLLSDDIAQGQMKFAS